MPQHLPWTHYTARAPPQYRQGVCASNKAVELTKLLCIRQRYSALVLSFGVCVCVQASVKNIGRVVQRMSSADLLPELQSRDLLPGLFEAFDHSSADVRKAVTMCLMYMWQVHKHCMY